MVRRNAGIGYWTRSQPCAFQPGKFHAARRCLCLEALLEGRYHRTRSARLAPGYRPALGCAGDWPRYQERSDSKADGEVRNPERSFSERLNLFGVGLGSAALPFG